MCVENEYVWWTRHVRTYLRVFLFFLVESVGGCCCCSLACLFAWSSFHLRSVSNIHAEWVKWVKNDTSIFNEVGFYWHVDTFLPFDCAVFPIKPKSAHSLSFPPVRSHIDMAIFSVPLFSLVRSLVRSLFFRGRCMNAVTLDVIY